MQPRWRRSCNVERLPCDSSRPHHHMFTSTRPLTPTHHHPLRAITLNNIASLPIPHHKCTTHATPSPLTPTALEHHCCTTHAPGHHHALLRSKTAAPPPHPGWPGRPTLLRTTPAPNTLTLCCPNHHCLALQHHRPLHGLRLGPSAPQRSMMPSPKHRVSPTHLFLNVVSCFPALLPRCTLLAHCSKPMEPKAAPLTWLRNGA